MKGVDNICFAVVARDREGKEKRLTLEARWKIIKPRYSRVGYWAAKPNSPQYVFTVSHRTSETYIRNHWIISLVIWWQRVRSIVFSLLGGPADVEVAEAFWYDEEEYRLADELAVDVEDMLAREDELSADADENDDREEE